MRIQESNIEKNSYITQNYKYTYVVQYNTRKEEKKS